MAAMHLSTPHSSVTVCDNIFWRHITEGYFRAYEMVESYKIIIHCRGPFHSSLLHCFQVLFTMFDSCWLQVFCFSLLWRFSYAHMRMSNPPPIRSPEEGVNVDFDQTSPLGVFPCKGFSNLPGHTPVASFAAGSTIPVKYGSPSHF